jgi:hypothetical protein
MTSQFTLEAYPMAPRKCPCTVVYFGRRFAEKHPETASWGLEKCTCYQGPPRKPVARNDAFSTINGFFSLANYSDWPRW